MARKYQPFLSGLVSDDPLASDATTLNSTQLADMMALSGSDTLTVVLDPDGVDGNPEVVYVTAHTASATSATITRAQEGTTAREHAENTVWRHVVTNVDFERLDTIEANSWVTTDRIAAENVTAAKLATDAVETAKIKDGAVSTAKLDDGAVTAGKLGTDAVDTENLVDGAVDASKLDSDAVETAKIKDGAVTTDKLDDGAVTAAKIAAPGRLVWTATGLLDAAVGKDALVFTSEVEDTLGHVATPSTSTFTAPADGTYTVLFEIEFEANNSIEYYPYVKGTIDSSTRYVSGVLPVTGDDSGRHGSVAFTAYLEASDTLSFGLGRRVPASGETSGVSALATFRLEVLRLSA